MTRVNDVLRLEYCLIYTFPVVIATYVNQLDFLSQLPLFVAFIFIGLSANMINDAIDLRNPEDAATHERLHGFQARDLFIASLMAFSCAAVFLWSVMVTYPLVFVFFLLTVVTSLGYGLVKGLSSVPFVDQVLGIMGMLSFPYLMTIANGPIFALTLGDWILLILFIPAGLLIQTVQQTIDNENIGTLSEKTVHWIVLILCGLTVALGVVLVSYYRNLALLPCGFGVLIMLIEFLKPTGSSLEVKEVLIATGNVMMVYLLALVLLEVTMAF